MTLGLRGICKRFGAVTALDRVDLDIVPGEVLALLGENGAGKSTLMKIVYGFEAADAGRMYIDGREVRLAEPRAARAAGIGMVFQQWSLIPSLSVAENLMLAWPEQPRWLSPGAAAWGAVVARLREIAPEVDPAAPAGTLTVGQKQLVELVKVLNLGARILLLDEPTSVLARPEAERLWGQIKALAVSGVALVLITHKLDDVSACADRVAVMRAGRVVGETRSVVDHARIVGWMMGATNTASSPSPSLRAAEAPAISASPLLRMRDVRAAAASTVIDCPRLDVHGGEILGIAGVTGNGQELLGRLLAGVAQPERGQVLLDDCGRPPLVAYIPEQPTKNGCAADLSTLHNLMALEARRLAWIPRWSAVRRRAAETMDRFDVRPRDLDLPAGKLSGGNLQKLVVGREMSRQPTPTLVVACYPTMGLDLASAAAVVQHLLACAARGAAVVWISEDLDLLLQRAHRVAVLQRGRLLGPIPVADATREGLGAWMTGAPAA